MTISDDLVALRAQLHALDNNIAALGDARNLTLAAIRRLIGEDAIGVITDDNGVALFNVTRQARFSPEQAAEHFADRPDILAAITEPVVTAAAAKRVLSGNDYAACQRLTAQSIKAIA